MQSAKKALGITKYFVALPPARYLFALLLVSCLLGGAAMGALLARGLDWGAMLNGAGGAVLIIAVPAFLSAVVLRLLRRRVQWPRALAVATLSALVYLIFDMGALALRPVYPPAINLVFVGFGLAFFLWLGTLKFAFGLERSAWLFAIGQMMGFALFLLGGSSLLVGSALLAGTWYDLLIKSFLAVLVFVAMLYALLFIASGPLKKNLGLSSPDVLSMFASQWLYGENDLEEAFDEIGEPAHTLAALAVFETARGRLEWAVPYIHYGPFGNLGGSQFSALICRRLDNERRMGMVFHATATHDFDPVSSKELPRVMEAFERARRLIKPQAARFTLTAGRAGDSVCHLLRVGDRAVAAFTRAPHSTEDVNFAIGLSLMERARAAGYEAMVVDCHNSETGDVDYVEPGSPIAFEMSDALDAALAAKADGKPLRAGWAMREAEGLTGIGSAGIRVACLASSRDDPRFYVLLDSNGILARGRERLIRALRRRYGPRSFAEILTTDTHQMNTVRGVFNPVGSSQMAELEAAVMAAAEEAHGRLLPARFDLRKVRFSLRVLGAYQSAEIVSTLNAVFSVLRIVGPVGLVLAIAGLMLLLGRL